MVSPSLDFVYDLETFRNLFSACIVHVETKTRWIFETSDRRHQSQEFIDFLYWLRSIDARMVGFNNEGFDWPVCQAMIAIGPMFTAADAHAKAQQIIDAQNNDRFGQAVWADQRLVKQVDLYKIHHFDNRSKSTSLKKLEINMRAASVIDLPYSPHEPLTFEQMDHVIEYMCHDVNETLRFYQHSLEQIRFRDELPQDLGDVVNFNDTKIGKKYFEKAIEAANPGSTVEWVNGRKRPRQTHRSQIAVADIISPKVAFQRPEFQRVLDWLKQQVLTRTQIEDTLSDKVETKGVFKGLSATVDGFTLVFGAGGIHGAVENSKWFTKGTRQIQGRDVASFYPNLAIANRWYPEHLGEKFCDVYKQVYDLRKSYKKGTSENAMLKLALNGVYGDSNSIYGCFFDTAYTMKITINGQLLLAMLVERLLPVPTLKMIQVNTDGLEYILDCEHIPEVDRICKEWELLTGLELETENYTMFLQRDVNSYIAVSQ